MTIAIGATSVRTHIAEHGFINKLAQSLFADAPSLFRQHCHRAAQEIAFAILGPISQDSKAVASKLVERDASRGFAMFHHSENDAVGFSFGCIMLCSVHRLAGTAGLQRT